MASDSMREHAKRLCEEIRIVPKEGESEAYAVILTALVHYITTDQEYLEQLADALAADYERIAAEGYGEFRAEADKRGFIGIIRQNKTP